jgi:hypothetical protein
VTRHGDGPQYHAAGGSGRRAAIAPRCPGTERRQDRSASKFVPISSDSKGLEGLNAHFGCDSAWNKDPALECAPGGGQFSGCWFDSLLDVLVLELYRAQISEPGVEPTCVVDGVDEAWKIGCDLSLQSR